jgi:hypothetical protein
LHSCPGCQATASASASPADLRGLGFALSSMSLFALVFHATESSIARVAFNQIFFMYNNIAMTLTQVIVDIFDIVIIKKIAVRN